MPRLTKTDYDVIADRMLEKGFKPEEVFPLLEKAGFTVKVDGKTYRGVYAARVMAVMHSRDEEGGSEGTQALEL